MPVEPILLLQMQRMGDMVLTFPLMLWLQKRHPKTPIWVVGEPIFYESLLKISPHTFYIPWNNTATLKNKSFKKLINLSHRPEAAALANTLQSPEKTGPVATQGGPVYIHGAWQLYRASLVHNNRHNQFHWADLNALDVIGRQAIQSTSWPLPRIRKQSRVGLFLGASQEEKRPSAVFWARLTEQLAARGLIPVLLGGKAEKSLGKEVSSLCKHPVADLCGRFDLASFAHALEELSLLITPDTGPMHLASWIGVPSLNLSMGPVSPWETGPYQSGHHILQAALSCVGCWQCTNMTPYRCRQLFSPEKTAYVAQKLAAGRADDLRKSRLQGMRLFRTERDDLGLYRLAPLQLENTSQRALLGRFWSRFFACLFESTDRAPAATAWNELTNAAPWMTEPILKSATAMASSLARCSRSGQPLSEGFWHDFPPHLRPLSGYLQLFLQNHDFSSAGFRQALAAIETLSFFRG